MSKNSNYKAIFRLVFFKKLCEKMRMKKAYICILLAFFFILHLVFMATYGVDMFPKFRHSTHENVVNARNIYHGMRRHKKVIERRKNNMITPTFGDPWSDENHQKNGVKKINFSGLTLLKKPSFHLRETTMSSRSTFLSVDDKISSGYRVPWKAFKTTKKIKPHRNSKIMKTKLEFETSGSAYPEKTASSGNNSKLQKALNDFASDSNFHDSSYVLLPTKSSNTNNNNNNNNNNLNAKKKGKKVEEEEKEEKEEEENENDYDEYDYDEYDYDNGGMNRDIGSEVNTGPKSQFFHINLPYSSSYFVHLYSNP